MDRTQPEITRAEVVGGRRIPFSLFFGPPILENADGSASLEPPSRILEAGRAVFLQATCRVRVEGSGEVFSGTVHLIVGQGGRVDEVEVLESTGAPCSDEVLTRVASDLWYRWIPSDDFPAPVAVIQPITFTAVRGL